MPSETVSSPEAAESLGMIMGHAHQQGQGVLALSYDGQTWVAAYEFGREAEDSDMAGGASYAQSPHLPDALRRVAEEVSGMSAEVTR